MMKKTKRVLLFCLLGFGLISFNTSCKTGEGCDTEGFSAATDKDGNLSMKKGKSNLYSKKTRKKMKRK